MREKELLGRIAINPKVMVGKPVIKGTRLTVEYVLNLLAHGTTFEEILYEYGRPDQGRYPSLFALRNKVVGEYGLHASRFGDYLGAFSCR